MTDHTNDDPSNWPPQFIEAAAQAHHLVQTHGNAVLHEPEHMHLLETLEAYAPTPVLKSDAAQILRASRFAQASREIERIAAEHGKDAACGPEYAHLFVEAMRNAPDELADYALQTAKEMDLLPAASHVDDDGNPVYSIQEVAEKLGIPAEQVERDIQALGLKTAPVQTVRRLQ